MGIWWFCDFHLTENSDIIVLCKLYSTSCQSLTCHWDKILYLCPINSSHWVKITLWKYLYRCINFSDSLIKVAASEVGLLAPYRGDVVLKYAKPSRRNLDDWTEGAHGCLESRRPIYQINAVSSPHLYCFHAGWGTFRKSTEVGHVAFQHEYGFSNSMELDDCWRPSIIFHRHTVVPPGFHALCCCVAFRGSTGEVSVTIPVTFRLAHSRALLNCSLHHQ